MASPFPAVQSLVTQLHDFCSWHEQWKFGTVASLGVLNFFKLTFASWAAIMMAHVLWPSAIVNDQRLSEEKLVANITHEFYEFLNQENDVTEPFPFQESTDESC